MAAPFATAVVIPALVTQLKADTMLAGLLAEYAAGFGDGPAIYEAGQVPGGATFPYVTIGNETEVPFNTMGDVRSGGSNCTVQISAWSRQPSRAELDAIAAAVNAVLDAGTLTVAGYGSADCQFEIGPGEQTETVGGYRIRQLPLIYRVYVHES